MCLNNCKIVYPTTDIICYKYVKIRPDSDNHFTIVSPYYQKCPWVIGCCVYSNPVDSDYPDNVEKCIGHGFFHTLKSYYSAVREACCNGPYDDRMAVVECIIHKGATVYSGIVNWSIDEGYASTYLMVNRIVYLDKPEYDKKWYKGLSRKIEEYKNYRKQMKVFNKIKEYFNLNETNCSFNPKGDMIK